ncbi:MAG: 1-(5-phosphoribosyl)-5-[(5-phosphoribosylamino)methylideneamino]imidazole-4-carboxamide isomerase [Candidatus Sumerlaeia bacterium]|nr:1-(5-phosphoribosyl)-5-[(5-phosphoribosylamino)methylideneamino]imidazole-4-carboxamide isomerase [Candidatus Sumerlaeia bacterium]
MNSFQLIPAIDLLDGKVVRLQQGKRDQQTIYSSEPANFAENFERAGAERLHIIDLNGAFDGKFGNLELVREVRQVTRMQIELGGGIRSMKAAEEAWAAGVDDVILGTSAVEDHAFLRQILAQHGDRTIVGIDAKDGFVATRGWVEKSTLEATEFARMMRDLGCQKIIYTDISTDGMLSGPNLSAVRKISESVPELKVIASGGISSLTDIEAIMDLHLPNVVGVISGKALYDGQIDLALAVRLAKRRR